MGFVQDSGSESNMAYIKTETLAANLIFEESFGLPVDSAFDKLILDCLCKTLTDYGAEELKVRLRVIKDLNAV